MVQSSPRLLGGRYEIRSLIGRGGMAQVHLGRDTRLSRLVAIKMLRVDLARDAVFQTRFRREAQAAASLNHPNIVAVYDTGEEPVQSADGKTVMVPYIVMEYVEGHTVKELLSDGTPVPISEAVEITEGILAALSYSHAAGLVHRDIKPGNVMLTNSGKVKVMDFGIARAIADSQATMTSANAVVGTALYLSPEQARGEKLDERSDIYSAGCVLFELLTGRSPFSGDTAVSLAYQHVSEPPPVPSSIAPDVPPALDQVVLKSLAKNANQRYSSAADMASDLARASEGLPISAPPVAAWVSDTAATQAMAAHPMDQTQAMAYPGPRRADAAATAQYGNTSLTSTSTGSIPIQEGKKSSKASMIWIWLLILLAVGLVAGAVYMFLQNSDDQVEMTAVPDSLIGMTQAEARTAIEEAGLEINFVEEVASTEIEVGLVAEVDPQSGTELPVGETVNVALSSGPATVEVPNLENMTLAEVEAALTEAGLILGTVTPENSATVEKDRVIRTSPQKGAILPRDTEINIIIASGNVDVPQILGMSEADAVARLTEMGLKSSISREFSDTDAEGTVMRFAPQGEQPRGATINVTISQGPKPEPSPTPEPPQSGN